MKKKIQITERNAERLGLVVGLVWTISSLLIFGEAIRYGFLHAQSSISIAFPLLIVIAVAIIFLGRNILAKIFFACVEVKTDSSQVRYLSMMGKSEYAVAASLVVCSIGLFSYAPAPSTQLLQRTATTVNANTPILDYKTTVTKRSICATCEERV